MALRWEWNEKVGEAFVEQNGKEFKLELYQGNAYLIFIDMHDDDTYGVWSFWTDKSHAENCLGLKGDVSNMYTAYESRLTKFRFNRAKMKHPNEIIRMIMRAFDDITLELYTEEPLCPNCAYEGDCPRTVEGIEPTTDTGCQLFVDQITEWVD